ncbi:MAG: sel1 repeat family protein [Candidatus Paracaedibacteraceae bacterium]|nr:sel1 repeat family protein [Candidatus Paracaedibacteraceae bacterium]
MDIKPLTAVILTALLNITLCHAVGEKSLTPLLESETNPTLRQMEDSQEPNSQSSDFIDIETFKQMPLMDAKKILSTWSHHHPIHENYTLLLLNKLTSAPLTYFNLPKYLPTHIVTENGILLTVEWCKLRALQKDPESHYNLGTMYYKGYKIKQNYKLAFKYYLKAAKAGHAKARNNVATMYEKGQGVSKDYARAVKWYLAAVRRGHEKAKNNIKHHIGASSNFASFSHAPSTLASELQQIEGQITSIQDRYIKYSALCGGGFADNFGEMEYLKNQCETILPLIDNYKKFIQLLTTPTAFINCITLKDYRYYHHFVCPFHAHNGPYLSLENPKYLKEINKNLLPDLLNNLYNLATETYQTLDESQGNVEIIKGILLGIKRFNAEAYDFLDPLLSCYLNVLREQDKVAEYMKVMGFLKKLKKHLSKDLQFLQNFNERVHQLIVETAPYRNYLFHHHYPWLFQ